MEEKEAKEDQGDDRLQVGRIDAEDCFGLHGVQPNRRRGLFGPSADAAEWAQRVVWAFMGYVGLAQEVRWGFRGGFAPAPRLPFLLLIEEKEAKEDQGDDCLQVGRIGAESCLGLHRMLLNKRRGLFWPSWGAPGRRRRFVGAFAGASPPRPDFLFFS